MKRLHDYHRVVFKLYIANSMTQSFPQNLTESDECEFFSSLDSVYFTCSEGEQNSGYIESAIELKNSSVQELETRSYSEDNSFEYQTRPRRAHWIVDSDSSNSEDITDRLPKKGSCVSRSHSKMEIPDYSSKEERVARSRTRRNIDSASEPENGSNDVLEDLQNLDLDRSKSGISTRDLWEPPKTPPDRTKMPNVISTPHTPRSSNLHRYSKI